MNKRGIERYEAHLFGKSCWEELVQVQQSAQGHMTLEDALKRRRFAVLVDVQRVVPHENAE